MSFDYPGERSYEDSSKSFPASKNQLPPAGNVNEIPVVEKKETKFIEPCNSVYKNIPLGEV